jgi:predicted MFS family arabinose efflux permease
MKNRSGLTKYQVILMSVAAGFTAANVYVNQPILKEIAGSLGITEGQAGIISMLSQIGFGFGLFFITPLGDKISRKRVIVTLQTLSVFVLALIAAVGNVFIVWILSILLGMFAVSTQVITPMAASLDTVNRGKTVGFIFSGILTGILSARAISGFIAEWLGWRYVYALASLSILIISVLVRVSLPDSRSEFHGNYPELLRSSLHQVKRFPLLRQTSVAGGLFFGVFSSFWTTLTFYLSGPPFNYHADIIGLFGLVAIAGPLLTPAAGRLADKGFKSRLLLFSSLFVLTGLLLLKLFPQSVFVVGIVVLLLNIGVPANQITNLSIIYTLDQSSNSRINTIYMTTYFIGGSLGTFAGLMSWKYGGWNLVTWQMMIWALAGSAVVMKTVMVLEHYSFRISPGLKYLFSKGKVN